jgi:D-glycero-alpha-D-manno-heptose-7-phosphate kinase
MIISRTPLRISFAGGGSDLRAYYRHRPGAVVSTAIDKYAYITVNKKFDDRIRVGYSKIEIVNNVDEIEHNLVREALKLTGITKGIDIVYMSDMLPAHEGSGLGGSSSLIVGTLNALHAYKGEHVSAEILAKEACQIEIEILGRPIGKQDQYAAAYGGLNYIQFNPDESVFVDPIICRKETKEKLKKNLLLFFTGLKTQSTDAILSEQSKKTIDNLDTLDRMVELAKELKRALENNNLHDFGDILHQSWVYKQRLADGITNSTINDHYERARKAGVIGGKILGSGGGGCLLLYCEEKNQDKVRQALSNLKETPFNFEPQGSKIIYVG